MMHNSMNGGGLYAQMKTDAQYQGRRNGFFKALVLTALIVAGVAAAGIYL